MIDGASRGVSYRFGPFELDGRAGELRRGGRAVRVPGQSLEMLLALLEQPGRVVGREALRDRLWPDGTVVDFDHGLGNAVKRLRDALGDSAEGPVYVETLPRRGYRFVSKVTVVAHGAPVPLGPPPSARARDTGATLLAFAAAALVAAALLPGRSGEGHGAPRARLVVLPVENLTGDRGEDYFADGLTDELIAQLGRLHPERLAVIARTSSMRFRGARHLPDVARELDVQYVLEGSVRRDGERVRVAARLARASDQAQLWAGTFDGERSRVLDVQVRIAERVADALSLRLVPQRHARTRRDTERPASREAYLRGLYFLNKKTPAAVARSIGYLEEAVAVDPEYASAHAGLAAAAHFAGAMGVVSHAEARRRTAAAAERAIALDPELGEAYTVLAESRFRFGGETASVEDLFRRGLRLNPSDATAHHWYGMFLALTGRLAEGRTRLERARELDPLALHVQTDHAELLFLAGRRGEALALLERARELDPAFPKTWLVDAFIAEREGRHDDAIAALLRANELAPGTPKFLAALAEAYALAGRRTDARRTLGELRAWSGRAHVAPEWLRDVEARVEAGARGAAS